MPPVPLPKGISGLKDFPKLQEYYINLLRIPEGVVRFPGTDELLTGDGITRGAATWYVDNKPYYVSGNRLIRIEADFSKTDLGFIAGITDCVFSLGQVNLVIIVQSGKGYRYNETDGLVEITDPDFLPSVSVDFIDGRHVFIPADGSPAFYSEVDEAGTISPLSFFDAEELPDVNKVVINISNQLYIGGEQSFQIFRTNIDPDNVFIPRQGSRVDVGYVSGLIRIRTSFAFIGRRRDEGYKIYVMGSGDAQPISNSTLDELMNEEFTQDQIEAATVDSFEYKGYDVIVFTIADRSFSFLFEMASWSYVDSVLDGTALGPWQGKGITQAYGRYLVGNRNDSKIGQLSATPTEYGEDVEFEIQSFIRSERESYFEIEKLELDCLNGQKLTDERIGLKISRDGVLWPDDFHYRSFGTIGRYSQEIKWDPPGGIGTYENFMGFRLRSTADVRFGLESIQWL